MAAQFFQRVAHYLANELITKRLAESPTFLRAALRAHEHVNKGASWVKDIEGTLDKDVRFRELKLAKDKLKQAMESEDPAKTSPWAKRRL
jgi:hypothetical protein